MPRLNRMSMKGVWTRTSVSMCLLGLVSVACNGGTPVITAQVEARRLAAALRTDVAHANDAGNRAVMADTDDASAAAAKEARDYAAKAATELEELRPLLTSLRYARELETLAAFQQRFDEFQAIDAELLPLAVENTNLKAQRLSFGEAQESVDAMGGALAAAVGPSASGEAAAVAATTRAALLEIQVVQARHIAEADAAAMTRMEGVMAASEAEARSGLSRLGALLPPSSNAALAAAVAAFERFMATNRAIVELSRRNSNVRSLALSLGRKRVVAAACEDQLQALEEALSTHGFTATR